MQSTIYTKHPHFACSYPDDARLPWSGATTPNALSTPSGAARHDAVRPIRRLRAFHPRATTTAAALSRPPPAPPICQRPESQAPPHGQRSASRATGSSLAPQIRVGQSGRTTSGRRLHVHRLGSDDCRQLPGAPAGQANRRQQSRGQQSPWRPRWRCGDVIKTKT